MAIYEPQSVVGGKWAKASELAGVKRAKIVTETKPVPSQFKDEKSGETKMQDVAKVQFEGMGEVLNVNLNRATLNGLIAALGKDSKGWMGIYLSVETEKMRVSGRAVTALYLIPQGFKRIDDDNGFAVIVKEGEETPVVNLETPSEPMVNLEDIPF